MLRHKLRSTFLAMGILVFSADASTQIKSKQTLQSNYIINYKVLPQEANSISDIFSKGMLYGRLRTHWFFYEYEDDVSGETESHNILGVGGSLIYKTAPYAGFSATAGLYYTSAGTKLDNQPSEVGLIKSGKDVLNRYNAINGNGGSFAVLAQSYLQYEHDTFKARYGREIFNSFFTKSNDSKMVPNTFEGLTLESKNLENTHFKAAYLKAQKLRDHDNFHSVIMYDDRTSTLGNSNLNWSENDDASVHKGLNYSNFKAHGVDENTALVVVDGETRALGTDKLKVSGSGVYLKDLFYTGMLELNYKFDWGEGYSLSPGFRYVQQFDDGAGKIGGAALNGKASATTASSNVNLQPDANVRAAYSDPDSVDAKMYGARLILKKGAGSVSLGYTKVADEADFIAPWRGFVTAGYTRAMARYNWIANTESFRLRSTYNFDKANIVKGLKTYLSFTHEDFDESKNEGKDANVYYFGLIHDVQSVSNLSFRFRSEYVEQTAVDTNNHAEMRLELNYLF